MNCDISDQSYGDCRVMHHILFIFHRADVGNVYLVHGVCQRTVEGPSVQRLG